MLIFNPIRFYKPDPFIETCCLRNTLTGTPTALPLLPGSMPRMWSPVPAAPLVLTLLKSCCVYTVKERTPHSPALSAGPKFLWEDKLHFLPIVALPYIKVLSQVWAVEQTPQSPFCILTSPHPQTGSQPRVVEDAYKFFKLSQSLNPSWYSVRTPTI